MILSRNQKRQKHQNQTRSGSRASTLKLCLTTLPTIQLTERISNPIHLPTLNRPNHLTYLTLRMIPHQGPPLLTQVFDRTTRPGRLALVPRPKSLVRNFQPCQA